MRKRKNKRDRKKPQKSRVTWFACNSSIGFLDTSIYPNVYKHCRMCADCLWGNKSFFNITGIPLFVHTGTSGVTFLKELRTYIQKSYLVSKYIRYNRVNREIAMFVAMWNYITRASFKDVCATLFGDSDRIDDKEIHKSIIETCVLSIGKFVYVIWLFFFLMLYKCIHRLSL